MLTDQLKQAAAAKSSQPNQPGISAARSSQIAASTRVFQPTTSESKVYTFKVRVINALRKKDYDTYVLRGITKESMPSQVQLKKQILKQFGAGIVSSDLDFSVGFMKGNSKVTILSSADIDEVWTMVEACKDVVLWCEGVRKHDSSDDESEVEISESTSKNRNKKRKVSALEEKNNRVETIVETLREKHKGRFNTMQLWLWAEILDGGSWK